MTAVIEDDGRGIEPGVEAAGEGLGLVGMRERLALLDGRLRIESSPGAGTTIVAEVPLSMSDPVRVLVVDDHAVVRAGLRLLIDREESMVVVDEAADANEAIFRVMEHKPDVLLIDVTLPGESGIDAIPKLLAASPGTKILVLSMHDDPRYVREAFAAGASAYVLKEAADAEVVAAIREVAAGGSYVNPVLGARMVAAEAREQAEAEGRSAVRARARGAAAARSRSHEPGDRQVALHLGAHRRDAPRPHHAEARSRLPRGARALRAREADPRARRDQARPSSEGPRRPPGSSASSPGRDAGSPRSAEPTRRSPPRAPGR